MSETTEEPGHGEPTTGRRPTPAEIMTAIADRLTAAVLDPTTPAGVLAQLGAIAIHAAHEAAEGPDADHDLPPGQGHPELPPLLLHLPGPPWDPWRGLDPRMMRALEEQLRARRAVYLAEQIQDLGDSVRVRKAMADVRHDLHERRAGMSPDAIQVRVAARLGVPLHDPPDEPEVPKPTF